MILDPREEAMHPDDFVAAIVAEVDAHAQRQQIPTVWKRVIGSCTSEEELERVVVHRLTKGYHQELYVRDVAYATLQHAPNLRAQEGLIRQVDDEHRHAFWVGAELRKKGVIPETSRPSVEIQVLWDSLLGGAQRPGSFFGSLAATQLVVERGFGLQSTQGFAEAVAEREPEIASLYLDKIRRDELFHTMGLPEGLIRTYATTAEAQNEVRRGVRKGRLLLRLLEADAQAARAG